MTQQINWPEPYVTAERPPTEADGDKYGYILAYTCDHGCGWLAILRDAVVECSASYTHWLPLPPKPKPTPEPGTWWAFRACGRENVGRVERTGAGKRDLILKCIIGYYDLKYVTLIKQVWPEVEK